MIGAIVGTAQSNERPAWPKPSPETIRQARHQSALSLIGGVCFLGVLAGSWFLTLWLAATFPWLVLAIGYFGIAFGSLFLLALAWLLIFLGLERLTL